MSTKLNYSGFLSNKLDGIELLSVIDYVAKEKNIPKESIFKAIENGFLDAAKITYGTKSDIGVNLDRTTGEVGVFRSLNIVHTIQNHDTETSLDDAKKLYFNSKNDGRYIKYIGSNDNSNDVEIGGVLIEYLPPVGIDSGIAQLIKVAIKRGIKHSEMEMEYEKFKDRIYDIFIGVVKNIDKKMAVVDIGNVDAVLMRDQMIPRDSFTIGDKVKVCLTKVTRTNNDPQITLSRTDDMMVVKLMELEVPEIRDGQVEVVAVARDPGFRAKVAVFARDNSVDAIGACIGIKCSRVNNIARELCGEKIDIVLWDDDITQFVINALIPVRVSRVVFDDTQNIVRVVVHKDQLSVAIGRGGQNVKLASKLTGVNIDIITDEDETKRSIDEFNNLTNIFINTLEVDEIIAQLLVANGYLSLESIIDAPISILAEIEGFDEDLAAQLVSRVIEFLEWKSELIKLLTDNTFDNELIDYLDVNHFKINHQNDIITIDQDDILRFIKNDIKTLEKFLNIDINNFRTTS